MGGAGHLPTFRQVLPRATGRARRCLQEPGHPGPAPGAAGSASLALPAFGTSGLRAVGPVLCVVGSQQRLWRPHRAAAAPPRCDNHSGPRGPQTPCRWGGGGTEPGARRACSPRRGGPLGSLRVFSAGRPTRDTTGPLTPERKAQAVGRLCQDRRGLVTVAASTRQLVS